MSTVLSSLSILNCPFEVPKSKPVAAKEKIGSAEAASTGIRVTFMCQKNIPLRAKNVKTQ